MIREGNATPAWLANEFNASRRHALIVAQVIKLCQKITDDAVTLFIKLMGKLFSQANNRKKQRQMDCRANTAKALRMFLDTITARSEEHTSELQSLMRISYAVFCLKNKK